MKISGGGVLLTGGASPVGAARSREFLGRGGGRGGGVGKLPPGSPGGRGLFSPVQPGAGGAGEVVLFDNYALGSPEVAAFLAQDKRVRVVRGDITRLHELLDALDGIDGVFALAGFLTLPLSQNPGLGLDVNVHGMFNIVEACR